MRTNNKRGISLIVLVITIIVMIILAAAIILSLNSSGIIDRANKAKQDSDTASAKEYVSVLEAEWELMTEDQRAATGYSSMQKYVNAKLEKKGYKDIYYANETVTGTVATIKEKNIPIGVEVKGYALSNETSAKSITTSGGERNGYGCVNSGQPALITRDENITWKYIGTDNDENVLIAGDITATSPKIELSGDGAINSGPYILNRICSTLYSGTMGTASSMDSDDVARVLEYTGDISKKNVYEALEEGNYSLTNGSTALSFSGPFTDFYIKRTSTNYNVERADLIFLDYSYWLADSSFSITASYDSVVWIWFSSNCMGLWVLLRSNKLMTVITGTILGTTLIMAILYQSVRL